MNKYSIDDRVTYKVYNNTPEKALEKLLGYFEFFFGNETLRYETAKLYMKLGNNEKAGKYLYLIPNPTDVELKCIELYEASKGGDKMLILRDQIGNHTRSPKSLSKHSQIRLLKIMNDIKDEKDNIPKFAKNWYRYLIQFQYNEL